MAPDASDAPAAAQTIVHLTAEGSGVLPDGTAVPFALPGEGVSREGGRTLVEPSSPERAAPVCPLFTRCGGCAAQHMADGLYERWKRQRLTDPLERAGLSPPIAPMVRPPLASRRRATFTVRRAGRTVHFGYFARGTHEVVDVKGCPALAPALAAALPALREIGAAALACGPVRLTATACDNGIDVALSTDAPARRRRGERRAKTQHAPLLTASDPAIARITVDGETHFSRESPVIAVPGGVIAVPPGAFLQASREGEAALIARVVAGAEGTSCAADLFCGVGTFTLPLARTARVLAVEADGAALGAVSAAQRGSGAKPIKTLKRNLFSDPLSPAELAPFEAVVFDPPRAGALAQARALAASAVPAVIAVSCEPKTLARDLAVLVAGGYKITQVHPVDQFVASAHIEAVAVLRRD